MKSFNSPGGGAAAACRSVPRISSRGGTSHACVFDWIEQADIRPACIICLTDLETDFPVTSPTAPILWAVAGSCAATPPFGQVVHISP
jgi:predicted metal-dependent peptidase